MPTLERRITSTTDTIPASEALSGLVSSNTDTTCLTYVGTVDLLTVYKSPLFAKSLWLYVVAGTPNIARVTGISQVDFSAPNYTFLIQLNVGMTGASSSVVRVVIADLLAYSAVNTGGAAATFNGVSMAVGQDVTQSQLSPSGSRVIFQEAAVVDASSTSVFVIENS
jgi:hypothetical protein